MAAKIYRVDMGLLASQIESMGRLLELDWDEPTRADLEGVETMLSTLNQALEETGGDIRIKGC